MMVKEKNAAPVKTGPERLQKLLARAGYGSKARRLKSQHDIRAVFVD